MSKRTAAEWAWELVALMKEAMDDGFTFSTSDSDNYRLWISGETHSVIDVDGPYIG